ncbi:response regulator [Sphaerothrix gracilis]|uniref:response regulator n=1 Tax=Sphaerothrix gracilis TaxID=3151835 RepID=UPI0031FCC32B
MMIAETSATQPRSASKPRMLVVDDEPDNLDLLYRTFRRSFQVLRAESGQEALGLLSDCGEVAVIISDQRMPEMKGTEFLSKTVSNFPDTMRIILTGFTDVEDLVEAINAGQVYRYITKPWDPEELKDVVYRAAETYELMRQRNQELLESRQQTQLMLNILELVNKIETSAAILKPLAQSLRQALEANGCQVMLLAAQSIGQQESDGAINLSETLIQTAIAEKALQQQTSETQTQVVLPALYQKELVALIGLEWSPSQISSIEAIAWLEAVARQVGLALKSLA